jgi:hypothetical protein
MKALVAGVQARVPQRAALAILPAVIGLLPMPGGAIFSAPLVDEVDARRALMPILKTKINYWFRHVWEYWWPLYPGVLLAVDITGLSIVQFMLALFPLSLLSLVTGYFFLLRKVPEMEGKGNAIPKQKGENLGKLLMPIFIIIITFALMKIFFPQVARSNKYLPMIMGIFIAMLILQIQKPLPLSLWRKIFISQNTLSLVWIVALIRIYGAFIESTLPDGTLVMFHVKNELTTWGIPLLLMIIVVPFITGITTGLAVGFVGASFPIVMSFIAPAPPANILIATTILAYASGYMGMILSPVHVCLIVSNRHFQTSITKSIIKLIAPASMVLLGALAFYFLSMNLI